MVDVSHGKRDGKDVHMMQKVEIGDGGENDVRQDDGVDGAPRRIRKGCIGTRCVVQCRVEIGGLVLRC